MRSAIRGRDEANAPPTMPRLLAGLLFCGALLLPAATPASACGLDWADVGVVWTGASLGPNVFPMTTFGGAPCPPGQTVTITVAQTPGTGVFANGGVAPLSPKEDCAVGCSTDLFGAAHDLAVIFNASAAGTSAVTITATFSPPLSGLKFEITDIDFGGVAAPDPRLDQVVVASTVPAGSPTLSPKNLVGPYTFSIAGNTATANCTPGPFPTCTAGDETTAPSDTGTIVADFSALGPVTTVTITYNEAGSDDNPAARGIGVLANLTPVELMSFTIE